MSVFASQKRKRSANFTKGDKVLLCDLVKHHDKDGLISGLAAKSRSAGVVSKRNAVWDMIISDFNAATSSERGEPVDKKRLINMYCCIKEEARTLSDIRMHREAKRFKYACALTGGGKAPMPPPEIDPDSFDTEAGGDVKGPDEVSNPMEEIACSVTNNLVPFCPENAMLSIGSVKKFVQEATSSKNEDNSKSVTDNSKSDKEVNITKSMDTVDEITVIGDKLTKRSPDLQNSDMTKMSALQKARLEESQLTISILKLRQEKENLELQMLAEKRELVLENLKLQNEEKKANIELALVNTRVQLLKEKTLQGKIYAQVV